MTLIDKVINYGILNCDLNPLDANFVRNKIFHLLKTYDNNPFVKDLDSVKGLSTNDIYVELKNYIVSNNIFEDGFETEELIDEIFGLLLPNPSVVDEKFFKLKEEKSDLEAVLYLKRLGEASNYINMFNINKNIKWEQDFKDNLIEYTINLSKPEKSNADIAKALTMKNNSDDCPKCVLCYENEGYYGKFNKAARSSIRLVPVTLNNNQWYMQLSPYVYYENHIILLNAKHTPMVINEGTIRNLISFVDQYPSFFLGSNADLPIVGGSILSHEHYQGGTHILPVMKANIKYEYKTSEKTSTKVSYLNWYNSTLLLEGEDKEDLVKTFNKVMNTWIDFDCLPLGIEAHKDNTRHNTITPILRKVGNTYKLYLILRCNNVNETYPEGIFHVHPEYFNIKKEGIGLIEAQGLYILPGRLEKQVKLIEEYLLNNLDLEKFLAEHEDMKVHENMMKQLKLTVDLSKNVHQQIMDYVSNVGKEILKNTAVFKEDQVNELDSFMAKFGYKRG